MTNPQLLVQHTCQEVSQKCQLYDVTHTPDSMQDGGKACSYADHLKGLCNRINPYHFLCTYKATFEKQAVSNLVECDYGPLLQSTEDQWALLNESTSSSSTEPLDNRGKGTEDLAERVSEARHSAGAGSQSQPKHSASFYEGDGAPLTSSQQQQQQLRASSEVEFGSWQVCEVPHRTHSDIRVPHINGHSNHRLCGLAVPPPPGTKTHSSHHFKRQKSDLVLPKTQKETVGSKGSNKSSGRRKPKCSNDFRCKVMRYVNNGKANNEVKSETTGGSCSPRNHGFKSAGDGSVKSSRTGNTVNAQQALLHCAQRYYSNKTRQKQAVPTAEVECTDVRKGACIRTSSVRMASFKFEVEKKFITRSVVPANYHQHIRKGTSCSPTVSITSPSPCCMSATSPVLSPSPVSGEPLGLLGRSQSQHESSGDSPPPPGTITSPPWACKTVNNMVARSRPSIPSNAKGIVCPTAVETPLHVVSCTAKHGSHGKSSPPGKTGPPNCHQPLSMQ